MKYVVAFCVIAGIVSISAASPILPWTQEIPEVSTIAVFLTGYISMIFAGWVKKVKK